MTTTPTAAARVSGTIKERELYDLWVVADCLMSFCEFKDRILAAIQPDPEPKPVATTKQNYGDCLSSDLEPQPMAFGRQHFEPKRDSDRQPWDATPSSAGTVSVEKAAQVALDCAHGYVEMGNIVKAEACWFVACQIVALAGEEGK